MQVICDQCGQKIERKPSHAKRKSQHVFCDIKCKADWMRGRKLSPEQCVNISAAKQGSKNPRWKGRQIWEREHYRQMYPLQPCEVCGSPKAERHHKDGNRLNNAPDNIAFLCRKHHMQQDGRLRRLVRRITKLNKSNQRDENGHNVTSK